MSVRSHGTNKSKHSRKGRHQKKRSKSRSLRNATNKRAHFDMECNVDMIGHSIKGQESGNAAGGRGDGQTNVPPVANTNNAVMTSHEKKDSKVSMASTNSQDAVLVDSATGPRVASGSAAAAAAATATATAATGAAPSNTTGSNGIRSGKSPSASRHSLGNIMGNTPIAMHKLPSASGAQHSQHIPYHRKKRHSSKGMGRSRTGSRASIKKRHGKHKRNHSRTHTLNSSNVSDVVDGNVVRKVEEFSQQLMANKNDLEKRRDLCLEIEALIQGKIKLEMAKMERQADVGSIDTEANRIGFNTKERGKGEEHWKHLVREVFEVDAEAKELLVSTVHEVCGKWPQRKEELTLLRSVKDLFDEILTIADMSVRSFFNPNRSVGSLVDTDSTTWDDSDDSNEEDSDSDGSDSEDTTTEDSPSNTARKGRESRTRDSDDSEDEDDEEEESEESDSDYTDEEEDEDEDEDSEEESESSSSGWSAPTNLDDEREEENRIKIEGKFTKLDEFTLDPEEEEHFNLCQKMQTEKLGDEGVKYLKKHYDEIIGADFVDEYLIEKWKKSYKYRLKQRHYEQPQQQMKSGNVSKRKLLGQVANEQNGSSRRVDSRHRPPPNSKGVVGTPKQRTRSPKQKARLPRNGKPGHRGHGQYGRDQGRSVDRRLMD